MYRILLLYEELEKTYRLTDYLQLSGCEVVSSSLSRVREYRELLPDADLIIMNCDSVERYDRTCEALRMFTQIPIIVLSSNSDEWMKIKMFRSGVNDYLTEPYNQGELIARIHSQITWYQKLTRPFGYIQARDLEIEIANRRVLLKGKEIPLTVKEFDVLLYLAQHPNEVVRKEKIYSEVWDDDIGKGYYNSVSSYIRRIREKIEEESDSPKYVETIWGVGYRFRM